ncbi:hypothetical protein J6590_036702 [Homalodisca vitripennis]|nr:hypothetical protein J6590_036702 [Homalodisca vitripennis]
MSGVFAAWFEHISGAGDDNTLVLVRVEVGGCHGYHRPHRSVALKTLPTAPTQRALARLSSHPIPVPIRSVRYVSMARERKEETRSLVKTTGFISRVACVVIYANSEKCEIQQRLIDNGSEDCDTAAAEENAVVHTCRVIALLNSPGIPTARGYCAVAGGGGMLSRVCRDDVTSPPPSPSQSTVSLAYTCGIIAQTAQQKC